MENEESKKYDDPKIQAIYEEYCTIKTMALSGHKISRETAKKALKLKRRISKYEESLT
jgi:hypothetical protein